MQLSRIFLGFVAETHAFYGLTPLVNYTKKKSALQSAGDGDVVVHPKRSFIEKALAPHKHLVLY